MKLISTDLLIQYIYNELTSNDSEKVEVAINKNWAINEKYQLLKESIQKLPNIAIKPSQSSINSILKAAKYKKVSL